MLFFICLIFILMIFRINLVVINNILRWINVYVYIYVYIKNNISGLILNFNYVSL